MINSKPLNCLCLIAYLAIFSIGAAEPVSLLAVSSGVGSSPFTDFVSLQSWTSYLSTGIVSSYVSDSSSAMTAPNLFSYSASTDVSNTVSRTVSTVGSNAVSSIASNYGSNTVSNGISTTVSSIASNYGSNTVSNGISTTASSIASNYGSNTVSDGDSYAVSGAVSSRISTAVSSIASNYRSNTASNGIPTTVSSVASNYGSTTVSNGVSEAVSGTASNRISNAGYSMATSLGSNTDTVSNGISNAVSNYGSNTVSNGVSEAISGTVSNRISNAVSSNYGSDTVSNGDSYAVSGTVSNGVSNVVFSTVSNYGSDAASNAISYSAPIGVSNIVSSAVSSAVSDAISIGFSGGVSFIVSDSAGASQGSLSFSMPISLRTSVASLGISSPTSLIIILSSLSDSYASIKASYRSSGTGTESFQQPVSVSQSFGSIESRSMSFVTSFAGGISSCMLSHPMYQSSFNSLLLSRAGSHAQVASESISSDLSSIPISVFADSASMVHIQSNSISLIFQGSDMASVSYRIRSSMNQNSIQFISSSVVASNSISVLSDGSRLASISYRMGSSTNMHSMSQSGSFSMASQGFSISSDSRSMASYILSSAKSQSGMLASSSIRSIHNSNSQLSASNSNRNSAFSESMRLQSEASAQKSAIVISMSGSPERSITEISISTKRMSQSTLVGSSHSGFSISLLSIQKSDHLSANEQSISARYHSTQSQINSQHNSVSLSEYSQTIVTLSSASRRHSLSHAALSETSLGSLSTVFSSSSVLSESISQSAAGFTSSHSTSSSSQSFSASRSGLSGVSLSTINLPSTLTSAGSVRLSAFSQSGESKSNAGYSISPSSQGLSTSRFMSDISGESLSTINLPSTSTNAGSGRFSTLSQTEKSQSIAEYSSSPSSPGLSTSRFSSSQFGESLSAINIPSTSTNIGSERLSTFSQSGGSKSNAGYSISPSSQGLSTSRFMSDISGESLSTINLPSTSSSMGSGRLSTFSQSGGSKSNAGYSSSPSSPGLSTSRFSSSQFGESLSAINLPSTSTSAGSGRLSAFSQSGGSMSNAGYSISPSSQGLSTSRFMSDISGESLSTINLPSTSISMDSGRFSTLSQTEKSQSIAEYSSSPSSPGLSTSRFSSDMSGKSLSTINLPSTSTVMGSIQSSFNSIHRSGKSRSTIALSKPISSHNFVHSELSLRISAASSSAIILPSISSSISLGLSGTSIVQSAASFSAAELSTGTRSISAGQSFVRFSSSSPTFSSIRVESSISMQSKAGSLSSSSRIPFSNSHSSSLCVITLGSNSLSLMKSTSVAELSSVKIHSIASSQNSRIEFSISISLFQFSATLSRFESSGLVSNGIISYEIQPTFSPTKRPIADPTRRPTANPSRCPTANPSRCPTASPSRYPTANPSSSPTPSPTMLPSAQPTAFPSASPTHAPTVVPTTDPSVFPTVTPTSTPSEYPTPAPTVIPTVTPTQVPSSDPSAIPTVDPSSVPTASPTATPTASPTLLPTLAPTSLPTLKPTSSPSTLPTAFPTLTGGFTLKPSSAPTASPTADIVSWDKSFVYSGLRNQSKLDSLVSNFITFSSFDYRGDYVVGSCSDWKSVFLPKQLNLPLSTLYYTYMTVRYLSQNVFTGVSFTGSYTCNDATVVARIASALRSGSTYTTVCNSRVWAVYNCSGVSSFCVDCDRTCNIDTCGRNASAIYMNPCFSCNTRKQAWYYSMGLGYDYQKLYPQFREAITATALTSSITVDVNITTAGKIYCAAVDPSYAITTASQVRQLGYSTTAYQTGGNYSVVVKNVVAEYNYSVYCYTEDFLGNGMFYADVIATKASIRTPCCRKLSFQTITTKLAEKTLSSVNTFALDTLPRVTSTISLIATSLPDGCIYTTDQESAISFFPSRFTFSPSSLSLTSSFVYSGTPGCYSVMAAMSSGDSSIYANVSTKVFIRSTAVAPDPPQLLSSRFSDDGTQLIVTFDTPTDYGATVVTSAATSIFTCSKIVMFYGAPYTSCLWQSNSVLVALISAASSATTRLSLGSNVTLVKNIIMPVCPKSLTCSYASSNMVSVDAPSNPITPDVRLSSSATIASCDNIVIDASSTTGQASRNWISVAWSVTGPGSYLSNITSLLNTNYKEATKGLITIPNAFLQPGTFAITLQLTNFLGSRGQATVSVTVSSSSGLRKVSIAGPSSVTLSRWQSTNFFAISSSKGCSGNSIALDYSWAVFRDFVYAPNIINTATDKRFFKLKPYALDTNSTYVVQVTVSAEGNSASSSVFISLLQSGVDAVISGGSSRTVGIADTISLSADQSADIDYRNAPLTYTWMCSEISPTYGDACDSFTSTNSPYLSIAASSISSSSGTFSISVVVSNSNGLSDTASVTVTIIAASLPVVTLQSGSASKFSVSSSLTIGGIVTGNAPFSAQWSCDSLTLGSPLTLTPTQKSYSAGGTYGFSFVIAADSLTAGLTYSFQLMASYQDLSTSDAIASGTVTVVMNSPPMGGMISVSQSSGTALDDVFFISTYYWSDDAADLPLTYVLSYIAVGTTTRSVIKNSDTTTYVSAILGQGLEQYDYNVTIIADAYDIYGDYSSATTVVTVYPLTNLTLIQAAAAAALQQALLDGNPGAITQAVSATANSINAVNCTVPVDCSTINRDGCSMTANTCGACFSGFIGVDGDSNDPCLSSSARRLSECTADTECLAGICVNGTCVENQKTCPNDCSFNGDCIYLSVNDENLDACVVSNAFCHAQCNCSSGYYGKDCSLTLSDLSSRLSIRESMCVNLLASVALQDISSDAILSRTNLISSLLIDLDQLTELGYESCASVLVETVNADPTLVAQSSTASQCVKAFSSVLSLGASIPKPLYRQVSIALNTLSAAIQDTMVAGQDFSNFNTDAFRMSNGLVNSNEISGQSFAPPQSGLESYYDANQTSFQVNTNTTDSSGSFGVSIMQFNINPHGVPTNAISSGFELTMDSSSSAGDDSAADSTATVEFVLHNQQPVHYYSYPAFAGNSSCELADAPYNTTILCNLNSTHQVTCSGQESITFNYTCPEISFQPSCTLWDSAKRTYVTNQYCEVTNYDAMSTTCRCLVAPASRSDRRRRLQLVQTGITEFSASANTIVDNFGATLSVATTLNAATIAKNVVIFSVMTGIVVVLFVGLYFTIRKDLQEMDLGIAHYKEDLDSVVAVTADYTFDDFMHSITPTELLQTSISKKFNRVVVSYHDYIYSFSKFDEQGDFRTAAWLNAMGWTLMFLFMDTVLAALFFFDDGSCEKHTVRSDCLLQSSLDQVDTLCVWNDTTQICKFNEDIGNSTVSQFIMTGLITIFSIPFEKIFSISVDYVREFVTIKYLKGRQPRWRSPIDSLCLDLCMLETKKNVLLRGARLELMKRNIDEVSVAEEADSLSKLSVNEHAIIPEERKGLFQQWEIWHFLFMRKQFSHHFTAEDQKQKQKLEKRVKSAREESEKLLEQLAECETDYEREVMLIRSFQSNLLSSFRRFISTRFYDRGHIREEALKKGKVGIMHYVAVVFLPCYIFFTAFFVFLFGVRMGPHTTRLWLIGGVVSWVQELLMLKPIKIFLHWIVLSQIIYPDIRVIHSQLLSRARLIMSRTRGLIHSHQAAIQHLNPACRAARKYPHLQVARLLISVTDHDFPSLLASPMDSLKSSLWNIIKRVSERISLMLLVLLTFLPEDVQDVIIDFFGVVAAAGFLIGLAYLAKVHISIPIIIVILLLGFLFGGYAWFGVKKVVPVDADKLEAEMVETARKYLKFKDAKKWRPMHSLLDKGQQTAESIMGSVATMTGLVSQPHRKYTLEVDPMGREIPGHRGGGGAGEERELSDDPFGSLVGVVNATIGVSSKMTTPTASKHPSPLRTSPTKRVASRAVVETTKPTTVFKFAGSDASTARNVADVSADDSATNLFSAAVSEMEDKAQANHSNNSNKYASPAKSVYNSQKINVVNKTIPETSDGRWEDPTVGSQHQQQPTRAIAAPAAAIVQSRSRAPAPVSSTPTRAAVAAAVTATASPSAAPRHEPAANASVAEARFLYL